MQQMHFFCETRRLVGERCNNRYDTRVGYWRSGRNLLRNNLEPTKQLHLFGIAFCDDRDRRRQFSFLGADRGLPMA